MAYGTVKVDNITFDNGGSDQNVTVSGLYRATTSGVTLSGTIAAATVSGVTVIGSTTVSGATVTGTTANFTSGNFGNIISSAATMSGALIMANQQQVRFREAVGNGVNHIALQAPAIVSADQTITLPDQTGTVITTGDNGSVSSTMLATNLTISAAAGSASAPSIAFTGDTNTGIYSPGADQVAISTNGTERLRIDSSGKVGIGTSAPTQKLSVHGIASDTIDETTGVCKFQDSGGNGLLFGTRASSPYQSYIQSAFVADTSVAQYQLLLNPLGADVAIGTTAPLSTFHIAATGECKLIIGNEQTNTDGLKRSAIIKKADNNLEIRATESTVASETIFTRTASVESARIDSSGRLLVGTSTTAADNASVQIRNNSGTALQVFRSSADAFGPEIRITKTRGTEGSPGEVSSGDNLGYVVFSGYDGAAYSTAALIEANADGDWTTAGDTTDSPGRLVFSTTANGAASPTERLRIDSSGNVGIGTSTPGERLDIQGGGVKILNQGGASFLEIGQGTTTSQNAYIDLVGDTTYTDYGFRILRADAGPNSSSLLEHRGTGDFVIRAQEAAPFCFYTNNTERLRVNSTGLVGIGTSTPTSKLEVIGSIKGVSTSFGLFASNGSGTDQTSIGLRREGAPTDQKTWEILNGSIGGEFIIRTINDSYASSQDAFSVHRGSGVGVDNVRLYTSGSERFRIDSSGNVGINTSTPAATLDVFGNQLFSAANAQIQFNAGGPIIRSTSANTIAFLTDSTSERLRINSSGNVGIGTSSPTTLLDVNADTIRVRTARTPASASATGATGEICWDANYIYVCTATNTWKRTAISTW